MNTQYFIALIVQGNEYVVVEGTRVIAGLFSSAKEAIQAREALLEAGPVVAGDMTSERVANT